jgi:biopolymer transport protein ExbD
VGVAEEGSPQELKRVGPVGFLRSLQEQGRALMAMSIAARDDSDPIVDMNTTPLVDVMLVLLILFIITLPVMTNNTSLHIGGVPGPQPQREAITLSIDFDGTILWNGAVVQDLAQLERYFRVEAGAARAAGPPREVRHRRASARDRPAQRHAAHRFRGAGTLQGLKSQKDKRKRQHPGVLATRPA